MNMDIKVHWGTLIFMILNFIILMVILIRLLYRPIQGILEQRRKKVIKDLDDAASAKENAERLRHQAQIVLEEAHVEAYETVEKAKVEAERLREELYTQVTREVDQMRRRASSEIERSKKIARNELRDEAVNIALLAVKKILGANMPKSVNEMLIQDVLDEIVKEERVDHDFPYSS
jgi:F-type H+-transporting ATPase subunit b